MKTLIIYAHPSHNGHHGYFLAQCEKYLQEKNMDFEVLDLYRESFNPCLSANELSGGHQTEGVIKEYQDKITRADKLIIIYPTWWQGAPAMLKGFFDRVFSAHFGFIYQHGVPIGLLKGRRAAVFSASGSPRWYNKFILHDRSLRTITRHTLRFCGIICRGFSVGSARKFSDRQKARIDKACQAAMRYLYR